MTTPFRRLLARTRDALFGGEPEGARPPEHLGRMVDDFVRHYPRATRRQWAEMATRLAEEAYGEGFRVGYERRNLEPAQLTDMPPELIADLEHPEWRQTAVLGDMGHPADQDGAEELPQDPAYVPEED